MSHLKLWIVIVALSLPSVVRAGGFELLEQTPAGVGTSGAQSAEVDDPGAVFYNPAKMTYIKGFYGQAAINIINARTHGVPPAGQGDTKESSLTSYEPTIFGVQRLGPRFAVGIGGFSNFAQTYAWAPNNFGGRFLGYALDLTTLTINPSVAFRPLPWLSIGVGIDIVPASFEIRQTLYFGGSEGDVHASGSAVGVGGNLGLYIRAVPRWLDFAFTYRSAVDLDFEGSAALTIPPELAGMAAPFQTAKANITLPHNFTFGVGSHLAKNLSVDFDVHVTLWDVLKALTLTLTDPNAPAGTPPTTQSQELDFRISYGLRLGFEYRLLEERLRLRIGGGYERTPVPKNTVIPVNTDADRGLVSIGIGYHYKWFGADVAYLAAILPERVSSNPTFRATYDSIGHVVAIGLSLHFDQVGPAIKEQNFQ